MRVTIEIDCDSIEELAGHLNDVIRRVYIETARLGLDWEVDEFSSNMNVNLEDMNCYGNRDVSILGHEEIQFNGPEIIKLNQ